MNQSSKILCLTHAPFFFPPTHTLLTSGPYKTPQKAPFKKKEKERTREIYFKYILILNYFLTKHVVLREKKRKHLPDLSVLPSLMSLVEKCLKIR